jgi:putative mRNA 3-end processing factor
MRLMHLNEEIGLDSPAPISFVSHAHSDHLAGLKSERIIASPETIALCGLNKKSEDVEGARMIEAGHILGARQFVLENEQKIIYTGDISLKENIFGFKAKIEECDRLIMEATYSSPEYQFENPFVVYEQIAKWIKENEQANIIIGAYELGKAQEIARVLNEYCGRAPIVAEKTEDFCAVYDSFGFKIDRVVVGSDEAEEEMSHPFVAIVPMRFAKKSFAKKIELAFGRKTLVAVATGWALKFRYNADKAFALSDHADFNDLLFYIEQSGAREIEFFEGDGSALLNRLRFASATLIDSTPARSLAYEKI